MRLGFKGLSGLLLLALGAFAYADEKALPDFSSLAKENSQSVVNITVYSNRSPREDGPNMDDFLRNIPPELRPFFDIRPDEGGEGGDSDVPPAPQKMALGSGFIWDGQKGYIITNRHVIDGADRIVVTFQDRTQADGKLLGADAASDLAVIQVPLRKDKQPYRSVKFPESYSVSPGDWVLAIGSPFGLDYTVTAGVISAVNRALPSSAYVPFLQSDVAINRGNSGGPLFNVKGEVVGINSQIFTQTGDYAGISFSIPIDYALSIAKRLSERKVIHRGYLGVNIGNVTYEISKAYGLDAPLGAIVTRVIPEGPAEKAGLKVEDIILSVDDEPIQTFNDLPILVGQKDPDSKHTLGVFRDGKPTRVSVVLGELHSDKTQASGSREKQDKKAANPLGVQVRDLTPNERAALGHDGVVVTRVTEGPAASGGVLPGDLIMRMNRKAIRSVKEFSAVSLPKGKPVPVLVYRRGLSMILTLQLN